MSNTPVHESLLTLRSEGFIHLVARKGFVVAQVSEQDIRDLFWAQAQFTAELAARAARKITAEQIAKLKAIHEEFERQSTPATGKASPTSATTSTAR